MKNITLVLAIVLGSITFFSLDGFSVRSAKVIYKKGKVEVQKRSRGAWKVFNPTMRLTQRDRIRTGANSKVEIRLDDGSRIQLLSNSSAYLKKYSKSRLSRRSNVMLTKGSIFANVKKLKRRGYFRISTVTGVAGVRGTEFYVNIDKTNKMAVEVYEGKVNVGSKKGRILVKKGYESAIEPNMAPKKPKVIKVKRKIEWKR